MASDDFPNLDQTLSGWWHTPAIIVVLAAVGGWFWSGVLGLILCAGAAVGLIAATTALLTRHDRAALQFLKNERFSEAKDAFRRSYRLFRDHYRLDDLRRHLVVRPPVINYRLRALLGIALAYLRVGALDKAYNYCRRAEVEFPGRPEVRQAKTHVKTIKARGGDEGGPRNPHRTELTESLEE